MPSYELIYLNIRGRAEVVRMLFLLAGKEYTDTRVEFADWPALKATGISEHGQLPVMKVTSWNGSSYTICQSMAMARMVATKFNLMGKNEQERAEVDAQCDMMVDMFNAFVKYKFEADAGKQKELYKNLNDVVLPTGFKSLEARLANNNTGFVIGKKITMADVLLICVLKQVESAASVDIAMALADFPRLAAHRSKIESIPVLAEWIKNRPDTEL